MSRQRILVWDWPVRLGHWLMVAGFAVAWLTSESERLALVHAAAGAVVPAVIVFRLAWGLLGTRYACFADFVRGPRAVAAYLRSLLGPLPEHHIGHNPAGGWAILALLVLGGGIGGTGYAIFQDWGGHALEEAHEALAALMLAVVAGHVAGVVASSRLHRENLVRAMVDGHKEGAPDEAIASARPLVAVALLAWVAAAGWWVVA